MFAFLRLYMFVYAVSVTGTSLVGLSFETALSAVATTMGGVGPGMADVGRMDNFNFIHPLGKFILTLKKIAGRLETYALLLLVTPAFWMKVTGSLQPSRRAIRRRRRLCPCCLT